MTRLTAEIAREFLDYNPETGALTWKQRGELHFADTGNGRKQNASTWNKKFSGKPAFTTVGNHGYFVGAVFNRRYLAHRVIWLIVHGEWPPEEIDHINGCRTDNRLNNLRSVSRVENGRNMKRFIGNTSGVPGVNWLEPRGKWKATITLNTQSVHIGLYDNIDDAIAARKAAEAGHGFHKNHGRL